MRALTDSLAGQRERTVWDRIGHVRLGHSVVAMAAICAGGFALGIAAGVTSVQHAPLPGMATGRLGRPPSPVTMAARPKPPPVPIPRQAATKHAHATTSPVVAPQPASMTGGPPSDDAPPGSFSPAPWSGNDQGGPPPHQAHNIPTAGPPGDPWGPPPWASPPGPAWSATPPDQGHGDGLPGSDNGDDGG
jgi:hypothetical protein